MLIDVLSELGLGHKRLQFVKVHEKELVVGRWYHKVAESVSSSHAVYPAVYCCVRVCLLIEERGIRIRGNGNGQGRNRNCVQAQVMKYSQIWKVFVPVTTHRPPPPYPPPTLFRTVPKTLTF